MFVSGTQGRYNSLSFSVVSNAYSRCVWKFMTNRYLYHDNFLLYLIFVDDRNSIQLELASGNQTPSQ